MTDPKELEARLERLERGFAAIADAIRDISDMEGLPPEIKRRLDNLVLATVEL